MISEVKAFCEYCKQKMGKCSCGPTMALEYALNMDCGIPAIEDNYLWKNQITLIKYFHLLYIYQDPARRPAFKEFTTQYMFCEKGPEYETIRELFWEEFGEKHQAPPVRQRILLTNFDVFNDLMLQDCGFSSTEAKYKVTFFNWFIQTHPYSRFIQLIFPLDQLPLPPPIPERVEFAIVRGDSQVLKDRMRVIEFMNPGLTPREYIDYCYELLAELFAMEF